MLSEFDHRCGRFTVLWTGLIAYTLTAVPVCLGIEFRDTVNKPLTGANGSSSFKTTERFDTIHYLAIIERGYSYSPSHRSEVAFFPAYPLLAKLSAS